MPSPSPGEELEVNDALKEIEVTRFYKKGSVLTIMFGENKMLQFDVDKNMVQKTKENLEEVANSIDFDAGILAKLKFILGRDYDEYLKLPEEGDKEEQEKAKPARIALKLTQEKCKKLFLDQFGTPYIALTINDHIETLQLKSSRFRNWLNMEYHLSEDDTVGGEILTTVINILTAKAEFDRTSETIELFVRVGVLENQPNTIYYDLTNKKWEVVKITDEGWDVIPSQKAPIMFTRFSNQRPQVYPTESKSYPVDIFDQYIDLINLSKGKTPEGKEAAKPTRLMLKCYIVCLLFPRIPKAISMTRGEQGTAKTTGQGLVKMLIDPCTAKLLGVPESRNELIQILSHNYIAYFDNVSFLKDWIVDELCRAVTGSGNQKRRLFTDDEDVIANFMRGIGLNGINLGSARPDLIDRGLIHDFEQITDEERKLEQEVWTKFEELRPQVLAYIFDTLVKVLKLKKDGGIKLARLPRMADFALHCEMISRCMKKPDNDFINAFAKNIQIQTIESIASDSVAIVIMDLMKDRPKWEGAPTKLYSELQDIAYNLGINTIDKSWPKAPNALSRRLNVIKTALRKAGIDIKSITEDSHKNVVTVQITKISPQSPQSPQTEKEGVNRAQNASDMDGKNAGVFDKSKTDGRTHFEQETVQVPSEPIESKSEGKEVKLTESKKPYVDDEKVAQLLIDCLSFDFEFDPTDNNRIDAVSFVDSAGNCCEVKFRERDFGGNEASSVGLH